MVRSDSCSSVLVSQAWQPKATVTPSSSTAWKPSRESRLRCSLLGLLGPLLPYHSICTLLLLLFFFLLLFTARSISLSDSATMASLLQPSPCVVHDCDFCIQKMSLWKCLCSEETKIRVGPCSILTAEHACGINRGSSTCEHRHRPLRRYPFWSNASIVVSLALICYSCNGN
jgi:type VI protein secretion system component VasF